jgi:HSP20 family protein
MSYFDPFGITTRADPLDPWSDIGLGFGDWSSWGMPSGAYFDPLFGMMTGAGLIDPRRSPRRQQTQSQRAGESAKTETKIQTPLAAAPAEAAAASTCAQTTTTPSTSELPLQPQQQLSTDKDKEKEKAKELEREREQAGQQKEPEVPQPQQPLQVQVQGVLPQQAQQPTSAQQVHQGASTEEEVDAPIKRLAVRAHQRPTIDISESTDEYTLVVDFPGVKKEDLKVVVSGNSLSITGERKVPAGMDLSGKSNKSFRRAFGKFARTLQLPPHTDPSKVKAKYENGVLTVGIPKSRLDDSKLPRAIEVQ